MERANPEAHVQGVKDSPPGTPAEREEMEKIEALQGEHDTKMRVRTEGENAGQDVQPSGWVESKQG